MSDEHKRGQRKEIDTQSELEKDEDKRETSNEATGSHGRQVMEKKERE